MSSSPRRKAERLARQFKRPVPPVADNDPSPVFEIGAAAILANYTFLVARIRDQAHEMLDTFEKDTRASEEAATDFLKAPDEYCKAMVSAYHENARKMIVDGDTQAGLAFFGVATTVVRDRLYLLARDLTAERANRPSETASPEDPTD